MKEYFYKLLKQWRSKAGNLPNVTVLERSSAGIAFEIQVPLSQFNGKTIRIVESTNRLTLLLVNPNEPEEYKRMLKLDRQ